MITIRDPALALETWNVFVAKWKYRIKKINWFIYRQKSWISRWLLKIPCIEHYLTYDRVVKESDYLEYPPLRNLPRNTEATLEELYWLKFGKLYLRTAVTLFLMILSGLLLLSVYWELDNEYDKLSPSLLFDCDPDNLLSFYNEPTLFTASETQRKAFCMIKSGFTVGSTAMSFPFILHSLAVSSVLLLSSVRGKINIPISKDTYVGQTHCLNECMSNDPIKRLIWSILGFFCLPCFVYGFKKYGNNRSKKAWLRRSILFMIIQLLPDLLLKCSLSVLAYVYTIQAHTLEEAIFTLVLSQVLARLDVKFVNSVLNPRRSTGNRLWKYIRPNQKAQEAVYYPYEDYGAVSARNHFGVGDIRRYSREDSCLRTTFPCCFSRRKRTSSFDYIVKNAPKTPAIYPTRDL